MNTITLDAKDFLAGETQWDYITSGGGYSPDSYGLNLLLKPGVLNLGWTNTDRGGATLTGNPIAYAYDKTSLGNNSYILDASGAFYTLANDGTTFTKRQTVTADTFALGTADMIQYQGNVYATSDTRVIKLDNSNLTAVDSSWWTGLSSACRHPLEVVNDKLYIGNLNVIQTWDGASSVNSITLPPDVNITSLRKHPDGRHLVAFTGNTLDYTHLKGGPGKVYIINTDLLATEREIQTDSQVEGSRLLGGIIYVTYGQQVGYFTGSGIKFLKQLKTSATTYSHSMGNMEDLLLVRDGTNLLMYGSVAGGNNVWHNIYQGSTIQIVGYKGGSVVYIGTSAGTLLELDYATASGAGRFASKRYNFGSVVKIRRMDFLFDKKADGNVFNQSLFIRDTDDVTSLIPITVPNAGTANKKVLELNITTDVFQFLLSPSNGNPAYKLIRIYYEPITV